jgi:uncharacterized DUF497 family protein
MFERDAEKAAANLRIHGVAFQEAVMLSVTLSVSNKSTTVRTMAKSASACSACAAAQFST